MIEIEERPSLCVFARLAYWSAFIPVIGVALFMSLSFISLWQIGNKGRYGLFYLSKGLTVLIVLNISCLGLYWFAPQKEAFLHKKFRVGCENDLNINFFGDSIEISLMSNIRTEGYVRRHFELDSHRKAFGQWVGYYDNGVKAFEGEMRADQRVGKWTFYLRPPDPGRESYLTPKVESGKGLAYVCYYKNDLLEGDIVVYNRHGKILAKGKYKNGLPHGAWIHYRYEYKYTKFTTNTGQFSYGKKHGEWTERRGDKITVKCNYFNGLLDGEYCSWNYDGTVDKEGRYIQNSKDGKWVANENDGGLSEELFDKGKRLTYRKWNKNKLLIIELGEKLEGNRTRSRMWYDNGQLKSEDIYQNEKIILEQTWYPDGTLKERLEDGVQIYPEWTAP